MDVSAIDAGVRPRAVRRAAVFGALLAFALSHHARLRAFLDWRREP